jgi:ribosomal protein L44E
MNQTGRIKIEDNFDFSELRCPKCEGLRLHQATVSVFHRREDADETFRTIAREFETETAVVRSDTSGNPSYRRQGLTIEFECEQCHSVEPKSVIRLAFAQHKGLTLLHWEYS